MILTIKLDVIARLQLQPPLDAEGVELNISADRGVFVEYRKATIGGAPSGFTRIDIRAATVNDGLGNYTTRPIPCTFDEIVDVRILGSKDTQFLHATSFKWKLKR